MIYLHVGCGNCKHDGFVNSDKDMDMSKPWPYETESVDGIISMQVLQQLHWKDLVVALRESYRVLKKGGVMRFGTLVIDDKPLDYLLGWKNVIVFSEDLIYRVLTEIGYINIKRCKWRETSVPEFKKVDNRHDNTAYFECIK